MEKKTNPVSMIVIMAVIGMLISVFSGDFSIDRIMEGLEISSVEVLLDYLNIGLGFLALAGVFIFFVVRAARGEKEYYWNFEKEQKKDEDL